MPVKLLTTAEMREVDRRAIEERGIPASQLMEEAGRAIALDVADHLEPGPVIVLAGKGNNGGDGYVAARYLHNAGWRVQVVAFGAPTEGPAREAMAALPKEVPVLAAAEAGDLEALIADHDAAIDALLGTGFKGSVEGIYASAIKAINEAGIPSFSADIPSGLDGDSGRVLLAVQATRTITMGAPKIGFLKDDGPRHTGVVKVAPLSFPRDLIEGTPSKFWSYGLEDAAAALPARPADGHKGVFGLTVLVAGSERYPGAALLAAEGTLRSGCGLVRLITPDSVARLALGRFPELLYQSNTEDALDRARSIVAGPGMDTLATSGMDLRWVLANSTLPTVLDADALTMLAADQSLMDHLTERHLLTPHPGEMGRLLGSDAATVQGDRWGAAAEAAKRFGCSVLLKGNGSLLAEPDGTVTHIGAGNTAWSRGGAGDVLAGLIGGLMAQGLAPAAAGRLGAFAHGLAADLYVRDHSARGALTTEVASLLPRAFREIERAARPWDG